VTINPSAPPTGAIAITPEDGSTNVPVNTVVTARVETGDIRTVFNKDTFTLTPGVASEDESVERSGALASSVCVSGGFVRGSFSYNDSHTQARFTPNCPLEHNMTYIGAIAPGEASTSASPQSFVFTTAVELPDSDDDGADDEEDDHPHDRRKTDRWSPHGKGKIHIDAGDDSGPAIRGSMAISETCSRLNQTGKPEGYEFTDGLIQFQAEGVERGATATFKLTFPSGIAPGSKVYQADAGGFHEVADAVVTGDTVTMKVANVDADDGVVLVNPVGVAAPAESGTGSIDLANASGGGCAVAPGKTSGGAGAMAPMLLLLVGALLRRLRKPGRRG